MISYFRVQCALVGDGKSSCLKGKPKVSIRKSLYFCHGFVMVENGLRTNGWNWYLAVW